MESGGAAQDDKKRGVARDVRSGGRHTWGTLATPRYAADLRRRQTAIAISLPFGVRVEGAQRRRPPRRERGMLRWLRRLPLALDWCGRGWSVMWIWLRGCGRDLTSRFHVVYAWVERLFGRWSDSRPGQRGSGCLRHWPGGCPPSFLPVSDARTAWSCRSRSACSGFGARLAGWLFGIPPGCFLSERGQSRSWAACFYGGG